MHERECTRLQEQAYLDLHNAGKPMGFFKLPSMLTRPAPKMYRNEMSISVTQEEEVLMDKTLDKTLDSVSVQDPEERDSCMLSKMKVTETSFVSGRLGQTPAAPSTKTPLKRGYSHY